MMAHSNPKNRKSIDLITALEAFLMGRQECLYGNPMSNNFRKTSLLKNLELETFGTRKMKKFEGCSCARKRPVVL